MDQNRWKSPVLWASLVAQVLALLVLTGVIGQEWSNALSGIVAAVLEALVAFGVLNNPTDKSAF